jgi:hypothetical protein
MAELDARDDALEITQCGTRQWSYTCRIIHPDQARFTSDMLELYASQ